jgi:pyruvate formate lyase activating enzyme
MRCLFCQNWQISQAKPDETVNYDMPPAAVVDAAIKSNSKFIVYTYTEPTVFYEYMLDTAKLAKEKGLKNGMHSCGYINPEPLKELLKYMDAVNIDIKGFNESFYRKMSMMAELKPVLETIKAVRKAGVWLELTNLIIPGQNDDPKEIREMCVWIKENLGDDVPLHFSRFMPAFELQNLPPTPVSKLEEAYGIAKDVGLKYVYIGNVPGNHAENTYCPGCGKLLVGRVGYEITEYNIKGGKCKFCGYKIPGIWKDGG